MRSMLKNIFGVILDLPKVKRLKIFESDPSNKFKIYLCKNSRLFWKNGHI